MDSLRTCHRLFTIAVVATLAGCAAPGAVIRGSLSLPGAPAAAARSAAATSASGAEQNGAASPILPTGVRSGGGGGGQHGADSGAAKSGSRPPSASAAGPAHAPASAMVARGRLHAPRAGTRRARPDALDSRSGGGSALRPVRIGAEAAAEPDDASGPPSVAEAVLYIDPVGEPQADGRRPASTHARIGFEANRFVPRLVSIARGDSVVFVNRDHRWHNAFSVSPARHFDLGSIGPGSARAVRFEHAGPVRVFCRLHPDSSAYVFVAPTTVFTRPDVSGAFTLPPLKPGSYIVRGWHPRYGERRWRVELPRKGVVLALSF